MKRARIASTSLLALLLAGSSLAAEEGSTGRLLAPKGGESWCVGSTHAIRWETSLAGPEDPIQIDRSDDGGKTWQRIASVPNGGRYAWKVGGPVSPGCILRVSAASSGGSVAKAVAMAVVASREVPDYEWVNVTMKAPFAPRDGAGALVLGGRMWLLGGWNPGDKAHFPRVCNNEVWSSRDGLDWTLVRPNTFLDRAFDAERDWEGRHTAGYVVLRDRLWIVGGDANQGHYQSDVWNSPDGKNWHHVNEGHPVPWAPRALHYTVAFKDKIWVMGGQTMPAFAGGGEAFYRDVWNSSDGVRWERVEPREPFWSARGMIGGAAVFRGRIWILGGGTYDTPAHPARNYDHDVWSSADGVEWQLHEEDAPWEPRQYHDVAAFDGRLWVMEGYARRNLKDVWYSDDGTNWYELPDTPWAPRHAASVFVHDGGLWMVAGNNMQSDVWTLRRKPLTRPGGG